MRGVRVWIPGASSPGLGPSFCEGQVTLVLKVFVWLGWNSQQLELLMVEISLSVVPHPKLICKLPNGSWFISNVSLNFLLVVIPEPQLSLKALSLHANIKF